MKRIFDIVSSLIVLVIFSPFFFIISLLIALESRGGVLYKQVRIGKDEKPFYLLKFRTMKAGADQKGQITVGMKDPRITRVGGFLRRFKLDEIPQLFNIIKGDMSVVGPRPEVPKYVALYTAEQKKVLSVRPGLTDYASLQYIKENELLGKSADPEKTYIEEVIPAKLALNMKYVRERSFGLDLKLIFKTIGKLFS